MSKLSAPGRTNQLSRTLVILGLLVIVFTGAWIWWTKVLASPRQVFNGMLERSLSTHSVVRHVSQRGSDGQQDEYTQLSFGSQNLAHISTVTRQQDQNGQTSKVVTESIGTPQADYARYVSIDSAQTTATGRKVDYSKVEGVWGKSDTTNQPGNGRYFSQSILGIMPFGNLDQRKRKDLLNEIRQKGVYQPNYGNVKRISERGRSLYQYEVNIKPEAYVAMLKSYADAIGLDNVEGLDASGYANAPSITLIFTVDVLARQLVRINYPGETQSQHQENYSGYGAIETVDIPTNTISFNELQARTQQILQ